MQAGFGVYTHAQELIFFDQFNFVGHAAEEKPQFLQRRKWLCNVVVSTKFHGLDSGFNRAVTRHYRDLGTGQKTADAFQERKARHSWHDQIGQNDVRRLLLEAHARDPEIITPGSREAPEGGMSEGQARSVLSYMEKVRVGAPVPQVSPQTRTVSLILGRYCANCHMIDGDGASSAPDLTRVGASHDREWLHQWITSPEDVDPFASMPAFGEALSADEMNTLVDYLAPALASAQDSPQALRQPPRRSDL